MSKPMESWSDSTPTAQHAFIIACELPEHVLDTMLIIVESPTRLMALVLVACIIDEVSSIFFKKFDTKST